MPAAATRRELAWCGLALTLIAALAYGRHVLEGGFVWDDWQLAGRNRFPVEMEGGNVEGVFDHVLLGYRPLLGLLLPGVHAALGAQPVLHLALALVIAVVMSLAAFAAMRELGIEAWTAGAIAALAVIFPWGDSLRLWATAAINDVAVILYLIGFWCALRGLRTGRRALTVAALALYAASTLTYEVCAAAAVLSCVLYAPITGWARALRRGALDVAVVGSGLVFIALNTPREKSTPSELVDHAGVIADQALTVLARAVLPIPGAPRGAGLAVLAVIAGAAVVAVRRGLPGAAAVRRAGALAGAAIVGIVCAYALFIPADAHYQPLGPGVNNRIGLLAALPYSAFVVAVALVSGALVAAALRRPGMRSPIAVLVGGAIGAGWLVETTGNAGDWDRAADRQDVVLAAVQRALPSPPPNSIIYTAGEPIYVADGIPVFSVSWDLKPALRLRYGRRDVRGYALPVGSGLRCTSERAVPDAPAYDPGQGAVYGRGYVVDVPTARVTPIESFEACVDADARLRQP